jgi:hypothetical protein
MAEHIEALDLLQQTPLFAGLSKADLEILGSSIRVVTFPAEILGHWGWFNAEESVARGPDALTEEAAAILAGHRRAHPQGRVWVLPHLKSLNPPGRPREGNPHQVLFDLFVEECRREHLILSYPAGADAKDYARVGIIPLVFANATAG